jgi:hypothetical protein
VAKGGKAEMVQFPLYVEIRTYLRPDIGGVLQAGRDVRQPVDDGIWTIHFSLHHQRDSSTQQDSVVRYICRECFRLLGREYFATSKLRVPSPFLEVDKEFIEKRFELLRSEMTDHAENHVILGTAAISRLRETGWKIER